MNFEQCIDRKEIHVFTISLFGFVSVIHSRRYLYKLTHMSPLPCAAAVASVKALRRWLINKTKLEIFVSRFCRDYCSPGSLSVYIYQYCCHPGAHGLNPLRMKDKYIFISVLFAQVYCRNYTFILNFAILKTCINFKYELISWQNICYYRTSWVPRYPDANEIPNQ